ncbi:MAG: hypothetical protein AAFV93_16810 [Chloroflexota bacterium]
MKKSKRDISIGFRERLLHAKPFDHTIFTKPRNFTRHMTTIVQYPNRIYDVGRTVDVRRETEQSFIFEIRQKRYLGRGSFAISSCARGTIEYSPSNNQTRITGHVQLGGQYVLLLTIMSLIVLLSYALVLITVLFAPLALLMSAVVGLHWVYLFSDREDVQTQLAHLVDLTDRELRLQGNFADQERPMIEGRAENTQVSSTI